MEYERNKPVVPEKLNKKVDDLEAKLAWQVEKTSRLAAALKEVIEKISRIEAKQEECLAARKKEQGAGLSQDNTQELLNKLKYYSGMAEMGGQLLQILAGSAVLIIENIARGKESAFALGGGPGGEFDWAAMLKSANELLRGLGAQGSGSFGETPAGGD
ncbi:MAG: hypothetical protein AB1402_05370 [Bacillota bacterium]